MGYGNDMEQLKRIVPATIVALVFAVLGATAWADHGSMGFGLGTASPIVTGTA
jgi:hypothetical protein